MRHNIFGKQLNRDTGQRQALLKGLAGALIRSEAIETTQAKAEAAKGLLEKLITQARRATLNDIRQVESVIISKELVDKLVHDIAPRFTGRPGGYLRLVKLGSRVGDNAPMVRIELVSKQLPPEEIKEEKKPIKKVKAAAPKKPKAKAKASK
jgi:large subunit ribosomal protein L17